MKKWEAECCFSNPVCPYCDFEDEEWWDGKPAGQRDGDYWDVDCPDCGKSYKTKLFVSYDFETEKK